jgi:UDP-glucose 4-epimerase
VDLAKGHVAAVNWLFSSRASAGAAAAPCEVFNLGTGRPSSVKEVIAAFEKACGKPIPHTFGPRREGDVQGSWADASKAASVLGWKAGLGMEDMCRDAWKWVTSNPTGYAGATE